jgi:DNA-binding NarL/FixJ family response regulator
MIRVIIADGNAITREGVKVILSKYPDILVAGEAGNQLEAFQLACRGGWDVLLFDIATSGRDTGLEFLRELRRNDLRYKDNAGAVLILSMYPEDPYAVHALKAGALGYLRKDALPDELVNAIRKVAAGEMCISARVAQLMVRRLNSACNQPHEILSAREFEVLANLGAGRTPAQIARRLAVSAKTIGTYRTRLLQKLSMKSTAELMFYAIRHGLVPELNPYGVDRRPPAEESGTGLRRLQAGGGL